jgi:hypothetical protein
MNAALAYWGARQLDVGAWEHIYPLIFMTEIARFILYAYLSYSTHVAIMQHQKIQL